MKTALLILSIIFVVSGEDEMSRWAEYKAECAKSSKIPSYVIRAANKGNFTQESKLSEFYFCFFEKMGWLDDSSEIVCFSDVFDLRNTTAMADAADECCRCCAKKGDTSEDQVLNFVKCFLTTMLKSMEGIF